MAKVEIEIPDEVMADLKRQPPKPAEARATGGALA